MALFRKASAPSAEARALSYQSVWGSGGSYLTPLTADTSEQALRLVPVYAAARVFADGVSSLPLDEFTTAGGTRRPAPLSSIFARPAGHGSTQDWVAKAVVSMVLRGNAYGLPIDDRNLALTAVEWLHPDDVEVEDDCAAVPRWRVRGKPVERLIHIPNFVVPGRITGLSPIGAYKTTIETGLYAQQFGRDWFANGAVPSGVVSTEAAINEEQAGEVKTRWRKSVKNREPVVLGKGWDYKQVSVAAEESQFLATIKATANQVAAIYGLPPEDVGGEPGGSLTYSSVEHRAIARQESLRPYLTKLEAAFTALLPRPRFVKFNADAAIRMSTADRWSVHKVQIDSKAMTINEVRALNDLPSVAWGDAPYEPTPAAPAITEESS